MFMHSDLIANEWELCGMPNPDLRDERDSYSDEERGVGFERTLSGEKQYEGWKEEWM